MYLSSKLDESVKKWDYQQITDAFAMLKKCNVNISWVDSHVVITRQCVGDVMFTWLFSDVLFFWIDRRFCAYSFSVLLQLLDHLEKLWKFTRLACYTFQMLSSHILWNCVSHNWKQEPTKPFSNNGQLGAKCWSCQYASRTKQLSFWTFHQTEKGKLEDASTSKEAQVGA